MGFGVDVAHRQAAVVLAPPLGFSGAGRARASQLVRWEAVTRARGPREARGALQTDCLRAARETSALIPLCPLFFDSGDNCVRFACVLQHPIELHAASCATAGWRGHRAAEEQEERSGRRGLGNSTSHYGRNKHESSARLQSSSSYR
jgi:hypothetical protein